VPKESYQTKLLERIAYQTSGSMLEFDKYLEMVVKKPKYERKRLGRPPKEEKLSGVK